MVDHWSYFFLQLPRVKSRVVRTRKKKSGVGLQEKGNINSDVINGTRKKKSRDSIAAKYASAASPLHKRQSLLNI